MELNKCPHCGRTPVISGNEKKHWSVECQCGYGSAGLPSKEYAEKFWNEKISKYNPYADLPPSESMYNPFGLGTLKQRGKKAVQEELEED